MKPSKTRMVWCCASACVLLFSASAMASADSLTVMIEKYFSTLKEDFTACAGSSVVKQKKSSKTNGQFVKLLKKHMPLNMLAKTNAKGVVTSEHVRGEKPSKQKQNASDEAWFSTVAKSLKEYDAVVKEDNGRYYLYWSVPLFRKAAKTQRFDGAVMAKVDLWDCFHKIAETTTEPFVIRLNDISLYAHLWENKRIFVENGLTIPGIEKISVRYQKTGVSAQETTAVVSVKKDTLLTNVTTAPVEDKKGPAAAPAVKKQKRNSPVVVGIIILILVVAGLLLLQLRERAKQARLMKSLDTDDHRSYR